MSEPLCPFGDGRHKVLVTTWGQSCRYCHKTWQWVGDRLVATYDLPRLAAGEAQAATPASP